MLGEKLGTSPDPTGRIVRRCRWPGAVEVADSGPVAGDHQGLDAGPPLPPVALGATAFAEVVQQALQGVADEDAAVGPETPGAFDAVLGSGGAEELATDGREADVADPHRGGAEVGQGLGLAEAEVGASTEDPSDGLQPLQGGFALTVSRAVGASR